MRFAPFLCLTAGEKGVFLQLQRSSSVARSRWANARLRSDPWYDGLGNSSGYLGWTVFAAFHVGQRNGCNDVCNTDGKN